ncbi:MAG: glycosyltransferase, partial [Gammaproteobacteria bacterium]
MYFDSEKNTKNEKSPFIELDSFEIDTSILNYKYLDTYLKLQAITILESDDSITIATSNPEQNNLKLIRDYWTLQSKKSISIVATSRQNIFSVLEKHFFKENLHSASNMLYKIHPDLDSKKLLSKYEKIFFFMLAYVGLSLLVYQPLYTLLYVTFILTLGTFLAWIYKFILVIINILFPLRSKKHLNLSDDELPFYTILVPLFHENKMIVHQLIKSLKHFHYPPDKLDIKLLLEQDDEQTISVIQKMELPIQFHVLLVPKGKPLTKPRACNYGLAFSIGEYVTVFDAEDQPDPDQLRKVVDCFKKGEEKLICVQAHLNFYNSRDNILTRLFTIEYTTLFDQILAGIAHLKLFIPLGGTSNHFKTDKLKELGTWDANILTEDADIGIRLYRYGYKCTLINSTTYEEANTKLINWFKQRARWN